MPWPHQRELLYEAELPSILGSLLQRLVQTRLNGSPKEKDRKSAPFRSSEILSRVSFLSLAIHPRPPRPEEGFREIIRMLWSQRELIWPCSEERGCWFPLVIISPPRRAGPGLWCITQTSPTWPAVFGDVKPRVQPLYIETCCLPRINSCETKESPM